MTKLLQCEVCQETYMHVDGKHGAADIRIAVRRKPDLNALRRPLTGRCPVHAIHH